MAQVSDRRGLPGELVMLRLSFGTADVLDKPTDLAGDNRATTVTGQVHSKSLGMIVSVDVPGWTYVAWSNPVALGWIYDGVLRRIETKKRR